MIRVVWFVAGLAVVLGTWSSVLRTLVVPRGLTSRLTAAVTRVVRWLFETPAGWFTSYERKDAILVAEGPAVLLALLVTWLVMFVLGFALMFMAANHDGFGLALRESGASVFTLGNVGTPRMFPAILGYVAAATGLIVVALQIAYLPSLYAEFNRRETLVTTLQSRAGSPAWGPEVLARHHIVNTLDNLPAFYAEWERWAADVAESHTNYPVLIMFRSPHPLRSWVVGLLAVLDSAGMYLALNPGERQSEARLCLRMGFTSLRDICRAFGIPFNPDPHPDDPLRLTYEDFLTGIDRLRAVGYHMERSPEEAWPHFRGWRVNYEAEIYALASAVEAVPAVWSGPRRHSVEAMLPVRPVNRSPDAPEG